MFNVLFVYGLTAGLAASVVWAAATLVVDAAFLPILRHHAGQLHERVLAAPALSLFILAINLAAWGALFGWMYPLVYPVFKPFGSIIGGTIWGLILFVPYSRGSLETILFTKIPHELNIFRFVEGLVGMAVWGAALGQIFGRLIGQ